MLIQACPVRDRVRVAIAGVGNCASSFAQGLHYYRNVSGNEPIAGLMNADVGGYRLQDIEIAAAFDVSAAKVGRDVSEAIVAKPNNTARFFDVPGTGVIVQRAPTLDGLGHYLRDEIEESDAEPVDVAAALDAAHSDVLVSYLPVGSQKATEFYAERALEAGCALVNCIPVFIASEPEWQRRVIGPSGYFMKSPPRQFSDEEARTRTLRFIAGTN